jgi:glycosyltransferase involved in cell wall biosynthesis
MTGSVAVGTPSGIARAADRPRVLFVGATRYDLPLPAGLARKWDALQDRLDLRVVARAGSVSAGDDRFRLVDTRERARVGAAFYASLARVVATETREFEPEVVVCQSPYEACSCLAAWRLRRRRPKLIVELHADWRTATRLYGSRLRRALALPADRAALFAMRRADATRALSPWTARIAEDATGKRPVASFTTYFDLESFTERPVRPLPERPAIAWIGVLERYKDPEMLARAWRAVAPEMPEATLTIVGKGPLEHVVGGLEHDFPGRVRVAPRLEPPQIAELLDESTVLAMSSAEGSEGVPRVIMEAFTRGRPAICTSVGGVPDVVEPGRNGLLVGPGRPDELARALIRVLGDRRFAEQLAEGARGSAEAARWAPGAYAQSVREMIDRVMAGP